MSDLASLVIVIFVLACVCVLALYTVGRQEREIERLRKELKKGDHDV